ADALPGASTEGEAKKWDITQYVQQNIHLLAADERLTIWVAFTPEGTQYNVLGWPDALQVGVMDIGLTDSTVSSLRRAGFLPLPDRVGWRPYRIMLRWEELKQTSDPVAHAVQWARDKLMATGLIGPAP